MKSIKKILMFVTFAFIMIFCSSLLVPNLIQANAALIIGGKNSSQNAMLDADKAAGGNSNKSSSSTSSSSSISSSKNNSTSSSNSNYDPTSGRNNTDTNHVYTAHNSSTTTGNTEINTVAGSSKGGGGQFYGEYVTTGNGTIALSSTNNYDNQHYVPLSKRAAYSIICAYCNNYVNNNTGWYNIKDWVFQYENSDELKKDYYGHIAFEDDYDTNDILMLEAGSVARFLMLCDTVTATGFIETNEYIVSGIESAYVMNLNCDGDTNLNAVFDKDGNMLTIRTEVEGDYYKSNLYN